ncbi:hypothetical protein SISSUDRAFT_537426 [Sistotremastrum suecicum HHB10207 ss-3]|uniref:MYND-type domain-containing protein n=1 Tax=Sistotremastrum suecicum HHB10207 ss-3 TaxID=1314776 RepID=A0A165XR50_9AGAM|nr:hypothetical protein SISSUDRAFT_537426 [Sistotremastrum suecicum HHB10207 ss-3]
MEELWATLNDNADKMKKFSHQGRAAPGKSVKETVEERLLLAREANRNNVLFGLGGGFAAQGMADTNEAPSPTGMMHSVNMLRKIVIEDYDDGAAPDFSLVPPLLTRIRELFRVFYNFKVTSRRTPDLILCDFDHVFDVSVIMHEVGLTLQLDPPRLQALMDQIGGEFEKVVLDTEPDVGPYRKATAEYMDMYGIKPSGQVYWRLFRMFEKANEDDAVYATGWFYIDILVAFMLGPAETADQSRLQKKAMEKLVFWSCDKKIRDAFGDCLADSMRPIYWDNALLTRFCQVGGLGAILGDGGMNVSSGIAGTAIRTLPDAVWDMESDNSLPTTSKLLLDLGEMSKHRTADDIFLYGCHNIYKRYGIAPFIRAGESDEWHEPEFFCYVAQRLQDEGLPSRTEEEWKELLGDFRKMPVTVRGRYRWSGLDCAGRWEFIDYYGCDNRDCSEKAELLRHCQRPTGDEVINKEMDRRLYEWGNNMVICDACRSKPYCGVNCQQAAASSHAARCALIQRRQNQAINPPPADPMGWFQE